MVILSRQTNPERIGRKISAEDLEHLQTVVGELQAELAGLSNYGKLVQVTGTGHFIQVDRPKIVIDAIREVVAASRP
jgi:pimeloyl-ACP methyl ester carboxylesterase